MIIISSKVWTKKFAKFKYFLLSLRKYRLFCDNPKFKYFRPSSSPKEKTTICIVMSDFLQNLKSSKKSENVSLYSQYVYCVVCSDVTPLIFGALHTATSWIPALQPLQPQPG